MTGTKRAGLLAGGLLALLVAFLLLRPSSDDTPSTASRSTATGSAPAATTGAGAETPAPAFTTIRVVDGQPQGGVKTLSYVKGDTVRLRVRSDVADEIHIHGYDLKKDVEAGGTVEFTFPATLEGKFEIELEHAAAQIASLEVKPS